jgi:type I restriction enzyme S subunit
LSWSTVELGSVCQRVSVGHVGKTSEFYTDEAGVPFLRTQNVASNGVIFDDVKYITREFHEKLKKSTLAAGDVILSRVISTTINCGIVPKSLDGANCANIILARPDSNKLDSRFLVYYLRSGATQSKLLKRQVGSAQSVVNTSVLKSWEIPLPPLTEQKRIAAILDKADAIRRKRQQAIQLADDFLRAVFLDMFGDPVTNPKGWKVQPIACGIASITSGWSAKGESYPCKSNEYGVLKISSVTSGKFKPEENKFIHNEDIPEGKKLVFPKKGELLFSRANTRELVAATCIVPSDHNNIFLPDKLWNVRTNKELLPEFVNYLIWQPRFKETLTSQATGTSGSMLNISKGKFEATESIFPPLELQKKFKSIYWKVQELITRLDESLDECGNTFNSLSQKAFAGEL